MDTNERKALVAEALNEETSEERKAEAAMLLVGHVFDILERATVALEALADAKGVAPRIDLRGTTA